MSFTNLVAVRTFVNRVEAEIARSVLEAADIHAVIERDDCGGTRPSLWLSGITLLVRPDDLRTADEILRTPAIYATPQAAPSGGSATTIYDFMVRTIDGTSLPLSRFREQVMLIVNVASRCGFTPQYSGLEALYRKYSDDGFVVLGFPCNQFGRQEPGAEAQIQAFCRETYEVTFPLFAKVDVNGPNAHPLFNFLKSRKRGWLGSESIKWNFTKFLIARDGEVIGRYGPADAPAEIESDVARALESSSRAQSR